MKIRYYLLGPALMAIFTPALLATPGCSSDTCQGASAKICSKACECGSCNVSGLKFPSKAACSLALGGQCDPTKNDVDWAACSLALDTAMCQGGSGTSSASGGGASSTASSSASGSGGGSGGGNSTSGGDGVLVVPEECSAPIAGTDGGSDAGTGGASASSSGSK